jgi:hypothetical protein
MTPGCREMQGSCLFQEALLITGGRNDKGEVLSDVWKLYGTHSLPTNYDVTTENMKGMFIDHLEFSWEKMDNMTLTIGRCAHNLICLDDMSLVLFGGFTSNGEVSNDLLLYHNIDNKESDNNIIISKNTWITIDINSPDNKNIQGRFGSTMCTTSFLYNPLYIKKNEEVPEKSLGFLIFGGVDIEHDYSDIWYYNLIK